MASEVVGRLRTDLILNAKQFEDGVNRAQAKVHGFAGTIKSAAKSVAGFAAIGAGGFGIYSVISSLKQQFQTIEELGKQSKITGVGVEALAGLQYAAKLSETDISDLNIALRFMGKNLSDAGIEGKAAETMLANLRLNVKDLRTMKPEDQFLTIADAISRLADPADRIKAAMAIFGKGGSATLPLLMEGRDAIAAMVAEGKSASGVTEKITADVMEANDAIDKMAAKWRGVWTIVSGKVAPAITHILTDLETIGKGKVPSELAVPKSDKNLRDFLGDNPFYGKAVRFTPEFGTNGAWSSPYPNRAALDAAVASPAAAKAAKPPTLELASGKMLPMLSKLGTKIMGSATSALNTAWRMGADVGGLPLDAAAAAGTGIKNVGAVLDELHQAAYDRTKQMILSRQIPSMQLGGGAEKGSAAAYSAIVRAMGQDMAKKETLRIQKQQLDALNKSAKSLGIIEKGLGKEQVLNLDAL